MSNDQAAPPQPVGGKRNFFAVEDWMAAAADNYELWAFGTIVFGVFMCIVAAIMLHINSVPFTGEFKPPLPALPGAAKLPAGGKEVGYFMAPNWAIYSVLVLPCIVWCGLQVWRDIPATITDLAHRRMIRNASDFTPVDEAALVARWRRRMRFMRWFFVLIVVLGVVFIMYDWWSTVAGPLLNPRSVLDLQTHKPRPLDSRNFEYDWSISYIFQHGTTLRWELFVFTFIGYVGIPTFSAILVLETLGCIFAFVTFLRNGTGKRSAWVIVANPSRKSDRRCGWSVFEDFYNHALLFALFVLIGLWFVVVQNLYLRDFHSANIALYAFGPTTELLHKIQEGSTKDIGDEINKWLFTQVGDANAMISDKKPGTNSILFGAVCYSTIVASWLILRGAAMKSKELALDNLDTIANECGIKAKYAKKRLKKMRYWPIAWIAQLPLLLLMTIFFVSLFFHRLVVVVVIVAIMSALHAAYEATKKLFKDDDKDDDDDEDEDDE